MSRRAFLALGSFATVGACAPFSKESPFWGTMAAGVSPPENARLSREYVDQLPYASIGAWFDGSPKALLVLAKIESRDRYRYIWHSAEGQAITTEGPFVVKAIGTPLELRSTQISPALIDLRKGEGITFVRTLDVWAEGSRHRFDVKSRFQRESLEKVNLLGETRQLRQIVESVSAEGKPQYRNDYWIDDDDGYCWKSRQIVVPRMPHLNIEILKRPPGPA